jgi:NADH-quinone oxidoreductase subunit C
LASDADTQTTSTEDDAAPPERDEALEALVASVTNELGDAVVGSHIRPGDTAWVRVSRDAWPTLAEAARRRLGFVFFDFLSAIDWLPSPFARDMDSQEDLVASGAPEREPVEQVTGYAGGDTRFQVLARVYSLDEHRGLICKVDLPDAELSVGTWTGVFAGADWHEREAWEMFGIGFVGHPGLRHLYLPGDFEGNPLRKDYPLLARRVKPWPGIVDVEQLPGDDDEEADS